MNSSMITKEAIVVKQAILPKELALGVSSVEPCEQDACQGDGCNDDTGCSNDAGCGQDC